MKVFELSKKLPTGLSSLIKDILENPHKYKNIFIAYETYQKEGSAIGYKSSCEGISRMMGVIEVAKNIAFSDWNNASISFPEPYDQ